MRSAPAAPVSVVDHSTREAQRRPRIPKKLGWELTFVCAAGICALATLVGCLVGGGDGVRGSVGGLFGVLGVLALGANLPVGRRVAGPRAGMATMIGALGLLPPVFVAALISYGSPIIAGDWLCGSGAIATVIFGVPFTALSVSVSTAVGLWAVRRPRPRLRNALAAGAATSLLLSSIVLAGSLAHLDRPQPDAWPETLPLVTTVVFDDAETGAVGREVHRVNSSTALERLCVAETWDDRRSHCTIRLRPVSADADLTSLDDCREQEGCGLTHPIGVSATSTLGVLRHERTRLWLVTSGVDDTTRLAFDGELNPAWVEPTTIAQSIAPPWPWVIASGLGVLMALLALMRRFYLMSLMRRLWGGRAGRVEGDNIGFDDGELPARGALDSPVPDGPAIAHALRTPGHASYRADGTKSAWTATAGARAEQLDDARDRIAGWDAFALALLSNTMLPLLVVARSAGLF